MAPRYSRHSSTMLIRGSGVSRFAPLASRVPSGPRRAVMAAPSVVCPAAGSANGWSQVDAGESLSISCR